MSPPARNGAAMTYDSARKRVVLYGGYDGVVRGDTWEWDGTNWTETTPAQTLPPRNLPVMCFDPVTARTLVIGGVDPQGQPVSNILWEYDGTSWTQRAAATVPPGVAFTMARDPVRDRIALLVNDGPDTVHWEWNGSMWMRTAFALPPLDADGSVLFFDHGRKQLGMVALIETPPELALYYLTASGWQRPPAAVEPVARDAAAIAYDAMQTEAVMFGGLDTGASPLSDLWAWRGSHWSPLVPAPGPKPSARSGHAMAYDAARGEVLVVGGHTQSQRTGETWAWDGLAWRLAGTLPPHERMAIAYDAHRKRIVGFGGVALGFDGFDHHVAETWEWNGTAWAQIATTTVPTARSDFAMAYDARRERIVMFGGVNDYETLDDIWEYDGTSWQLRQPSRIPRARRGHIMAYDSVRARIVMMGGRSSPIDGDQLLSDTWEWDGTDWTAIATFTAPPPRRDHAATYDLATGRVVAFGGAGTDETWSYTYEGGLPSEVCDSGHDADRDGLVGCADPDCWWACTPECPPKAACASGTPRCGDAICDPLESCRSCKADCGACAPLCGDLFCDGETSCPGDCL
jgi:Kelch motif protein